MREVPVVRRKALYPTTPVWWELAEEPRCMAILIHQIVALQGSLKIGKTPWGSLSGFVALDDRILILIEHGRAEVSPMRRCAFQSRKIPSPLRDPLLRVPLKAHL